MLPLPTSPQAKLSRLQLLVLHLCRQLQLRELLHRHLMQPLQLLDRPLLPP